MIGKTFYTIRPGVRTQADSLWRTKLSKSLLYLVEETKLILIEAKEGLSKSKGAL